MTKIRIAINGFGRIGRSAFKIALTKPELEVVAINDLTEPAVLAGLLRYDSNYGPYDKKVSSDNNKEKANPVTFSAGTALAGLPSAAMRRSQAPTSAGSAALPCSTL